MKVSINLSSKNFYILAVSGGVDSMSLLHYFLTNKYKFAVVNFNHQKRAESIDEHLMIKKICDDNKIDYHHITLTVTESNFQEASRNLRYKHLESIALTYKTKYIVTAHHLDDQLETIIMKLLRGSNLYGYSGMKEESKRGGFIYLKPFLTLTKLELENYAKQQEVQYSNDYTNQEYDYLRNRIRHQVIPLLKQEGITKSQIISYSNQLSDSFDFIRQSTKSFINDDLSFDIDNFKSLHKAIKYDVVSYILESLEITKSTSRIEEIIKQLQSKKPNITIQLSSNYSLNKSYQFVFIKKTTKSLKKLPQVNVLFSDNNTSIPHNSIELCYNKLDFPLIVRYKQSGDILEFPFGHKKLSRLLIDKKVPKQSRDQLIIVTDQTNKILWIPNLYINQTLGNENKIYLTIKGD